MDPHARVACETLLADQCVVVAGEFKTRGSKDFVAVRERADALVRECAHFAGLPSGVLVHTRTAAYRR